MFLLWLYELSQAHSFITSFLWYWSQFNLYKSNLKAQTQQLCWVNAANGLLRWNNALSFCVSLRHIVMSIFNSGPFMFLVRLSPRWFSQLLWRIVHVNSRLCTSKPISSHQKEDVDALRTFTGHETHLTLDQKNTIPLAKDHRLVTRQDVHGRLYRVERLVTRQLFTRTFYWVSRLIARQVLYGAFGWIRRLVTRQIFNGTFHQVYWLVCWRRLNFFVSMSPALVDVSDSSTGS